MSAQQKPVRIQSSLHASFRQAKRRRGVPHAKAIPRSASPHTKKQSPVASSLLESALALPPSPAVRQGKHVEACGAHQCARAAPCRVVSCGIVWYRVVSGSVCGSPFDARATEQATPGSGRARTRGKPTSRSSKAIAARGSSTARAAFLAAATGTATSVTSAPPAVVPSPRRRARLGAAAARARALLAGGLTPSAKLRLPVDARADARQARSSGSGKRRPDAASAAAQWRDAVAMPPPPAPKPTPRDGGSGGDSKASGATPASDGGAVKAAGGLMGSVISVPRDDDVASFLSRRSTATSAAKATAVATDPDDNSTEALRRMKALRERSRLAQHRPLPQAHQLLCDMFKALDQGVDVSRGRGAGALMFQTLRHYVENVLNR